MADRWAKWRAEFGKETDYIIRLWSALHDPEQKSAFLETLREKKKASSRYSIYDDYPISESDTARARNECVEYVRSLRRPKIQDAGETEGLFQLSGDIPE